MERAKPVVSAWVAFRVAVIVASAAAALAVFLAAIGLGWQDVGVTGFRLDTNTGRIVEVSAGSPAARAGLRVGEVRRCEFARSHAARVAVRRRSGPAG